MKTLIICLAVIIVTLAAAVIALAVRQAGADNGQQRFLVWETCVLNGGQHCGPQPVP